MSRDADDLAERIVTLLREGRPSAELRPFGDGPLEAELVAQLRADRDISEQDLESALEKAFDWSLAEVLKRDASKASYDLLTSVALTAGFAKIRLEDRRIEKLAAIISQSKINAQPAREALAMLLRVLARTGTSIDHDTFARLADSEDMRLRAAAIELLGRHDSSVFVPKLAKAIGDGMSADQLLWSLAHDELAASSMMRRPDEPASRRVLKAVREALGRLDPSGAAKERWNARLARASTRAKKGWGRLDYARNDDGRRVDQAYAEARGG